jgi:tetratricopeptide (TPR) repeat protein
VQVARAMEPVPNALESEVRDLARIYAAHGRWEELAELYAKKLDSITAPHRRAEVLIALAEILRREYDDADGALRVLLEALYESPREDEVAKRIEAIANAADKWAAILATINAWVTHPALDARPSDRVDLCLRAAKWYVDLGHPEWGAEHVEKARSLAPADPRVARAWLRLVMTTGPSAAIEAARRRVLELDPTDEDALDGLQSSMRDREGELVSFLEGLVRGSASAKLNRVRVVIARLHEEKQPARALSTLEEALAADRTDAAVLAELDRHYEREGRFQDLLRVLDARLVHDRNADRTELHLRIARIVSEELLDPERAVGRLRQHIAEDPEAAPAYVALARVQAKRRLWEDAIATLELAVEVVTDDVARGAACLDIARIQLDELANPWAATDSLERGMKLDPGNDAISELLIRAYEKAGDLKKSLAAMVGVAHRKEDPLARADALCQAAAAYRVNMGDPLMSRRLYLEALRHVPEHVGALAELRAFALDRAEFAEAAEWIDRLQKCTDNRTTRTKLLVELAELRRDRLNDPDGAMHAFEEALSVDPNEWHAALPVAHGWFANGRNEEAADLLAQLARKSLPPDAQRYASVLQANVADARGERDLAFDCYARAVRLGDQTPRVLRAMAESAAASGQTLEAVKALRALLGVLPEDDITARTSAMRRLGDMRIALGDVKGASQEFERVLALDPEDRKATQSVIEIGVKLGAWEHVAMWEDRLLQLVSDPDERAAVLDAAIERWKRDPERSIDLLEQRLSLDPTDRKLLHEILSRQQQIKDFAGIARTIERIVALDSDRRRRAKYRIAAAKVHRDELGDKESAVRLFDAALDDDARALEAFAAIDAIHTESRDFKRLERAYRKMIHRAKRLEDPDLDFQLWHALGLIYRDRLGEADAAVEAFRMASSLRPDDARERRIVAEILEVNDRADLAMAELLEAVSRDPLEPSHHRALYELHLRRSDIDRAFVAASVLVVLGAADESMRSFHDGWRPRALPAYTSRLVGGALRQAIAHAELDPVVSSILASVARAARVAKARQSTIPPQPAQHREDPSAPSHRASAAFLRVATMLGVEPPALYLRKDLPGTLAVVASETRASVMAATVLEMPEPDVAFLSGKHLAQIDGEHALRLHFTAKSELRQILVGAISLAIGTEASDDVARALAAVMTSEELRRLKHAVARSSGRADIDRWMQCSDLTATRAGLLACGDLHVAARMVRNEPAVAGDLPQTQKLEELIRWAASERHHELRRAIGIDLRHPESGKHDSVAPSSHANALSM